MHGSNDCREPKCETVNDSRCPSAPRAPSAERDEQPYFSVAITVQNGNCVDIHEGDRMQVVNADGSLATGHRDSFDVGCSHSWDTRIVWDPRTSRYAMVCATDNAPKGTTLLTAGVIRAAKRLVRRK